MVNVHESGPAPAQARRQCAAGLRAFAGIRRGAVAAFIAVAIIPLVGALGLATDTARGYMVRAKLGEALDAAALAGGKNIFSANRDADINMYFDANFPEGWMQANVDGPFIVVNTDKTVLTLTATATIPTTFMRVLGFQTMTIAAETEVTRRSTCSTWSSPSTCPARWANR